MKLGRITRWVIGLDPGICIAMVESSKGTVVITRRVVPARFTGECERFVETRYSKSIVDSRRAVVITITAYNWVPDFAKGLVRDLRARWALEEAGVPYQVRFISHEEKLTPSYRALQPFSQVPAYQNDDVVLFDSGSDRTARRPLERG